MRLRNDANNGLNIGFGMDFVQILDLPMGIPLNQQAYQVSANKTLAPEITRVLQLHVVLANLGHHFSAGRTCETHKFSA